MCTFRRTHTHAPTCMVPVAATFGVPLPSPGSSWDLPFLILFLPPVRCFFLSQNWSSKYFMKQLDRSLSVVLACPKASKMHRTCSNMETFTELLIFQNKGNNSKDTEISPYLRGSLLFVWYHIEFLHSFFNSKLLVSSASNLIR